MTYQENKSFFLWKLLSTHLMWWPQKVKFRNKKMQTNSKHCQNCCLFQIPLKTNLNWVIIIVFFVISYSILQFSWKRFCKSMTIFDPIDWTVISYKTNKLWTFSYEGFLLLLIINERLIKLFIVRSIFVSLNTLQ